MAETKRLSQGAKCNDGWRQMSLLLPLLAGMAQIPKKICCFVAASKKVKANIHHEILKKHLVPWTNRSIIFHWQ
jgi:NifU-like protein involved in Fe-S cluster formation